MVSDKIPVKDLSDLPVVAKNILNSFPDRRIFALYGEMGAGKTTLIKAFCKELEVVDSVSSPTFALVYEYKTAGDSLVYHFDFYRIKDEREALEIGVEEYFNSGHYCFLEWPEKIINLLPEEIVKVCLQFSLSGIESERLLTINCKP